MGITYAYKNTGHSNWKRSRTWTGESERSLPLKVNVEQCFQLKPCKFSKLFHDAFGYSYSEFQGRYDQGSNPVLRLAGWFVSGLFCVFYVLFICLFCFSCVLCVFVCVHRLNKSLIKMWSFFQMGGDFLASKWFYSRLHHRIGSSCCSSATFRKTKHQIVGPLRRRFEEPCRLG